MALRDPRQLSVIIPCFNKVFWTQKTIESLIACTHSDLHLIIVDDGSSDNTFDYAMELGQRLNKEGKTRFWYHKNETNIGVNRSWNTGLRIAMAMEAQHICIANNDLLFTDGWDLPLLDALDNEGYWLVSPYSTEQSLPADWPKGSGRHTNPVGLPILGANFMFKPDLIRRIGYFPETLRHYFGDNFIYDMCRVRGLKYGHIENSYLHHFFCQTTRELDNNRWFKEDGKNYDDFCRNFKLEEQ